MFVVLGKEYGGGGNTGRTEGATGWKMFCTGNNGGAVGLSLGLLLSSEGDGSDGGRPCEGGGRGGCRKFELTSFIIF